MLQCCISFRHLLQVSIKNVWSVSDVCCKYVYMDVIVAIHMLQIYVCKCFTCFKRMLQKCFYVATLAGVSTRITKHDNFNNSLSIYKYNYLLKYIKTENNVSGCFWDGTPFEIIKSCFWDGTPLEIINFWCFQLPLKILSIIKGGWKHPSKN